MKKSLLLAAASLAVISCSKRAMENPNDSDVQNPNAVQFSTGGIAATPGSKVTGNPETGSESGLIFETGDQIGIYAVYHGKKLGAGDEFPTNTAVQYKQKFYDVTNVAGASDAVPFLATFKPSTTTGSDETIYYLPGGQGWNYYAFYPTSNQSGKTLSNYMATESSSISTTCWTTQTGVFQETSSGSGEWEHVPGQAWPGPYLYAYYDQEDKAPAVGTSATPVKLTFKHAVAKLSLEVTIDKTVGAAADLSAIELFADAGLYQGFTIDLKQAHEANPEVIKTNSTSGTLLDGTGTGNTARTYKFQNLTQKVTDPDASKTLTNVIGYLIPTTGIKNAKIRFTFGTGSNAQVFTAKLDKSSTGDDKTASGTNYLDEIIAGKDYQFKINIQKTGVEFTGTIEDWSVEDKTGDIIDAE
ncbi:MAG: fimbrillin family protein [Rikenella sp.]|nr:fimbrillin family protein [Rikenella sp.]